MRRTLSVAILVGWLVLCSVLPASAAEARSIGLSAAKFDFTAEAGQTGKGMVWLSNDGKGPVSVRVYSSDQNIDATGTVTYVTPTADTDVLQSPASWVTVVLPPDSKSLANVPYVTMKPGKRLKVNFQVKIPEGAVPGDHNILLFFETFEPAGTAQTGSNARLGARIKARVAGEVIEDVDVAPFVMPAFVLGSSVPYDFTINNKGNVDERVGARFIALDSSDAEVASTEVATDTVVYANSSLQKRGTLEAANKIGRLLYRLEVTYPSAAAGANGLVKTVEEERSIWIIPRWLAYALAAALLILVMYLIWMMGRRSARRRARSSRPRSRRTVAVEEPQSPVS